MKKIVGALALIFALASCTQVKIAHVDVEEILKEYKGSKKAEEEKAKRKFRRHGQVVYIEDIRHFGKR